MEKEILYALVEKWEYKGNFNSKPVEDSESGRIYEAVDKETERTKRQCAADLRALIQILAK